MNGKDDDYALLVGLDWADETHDLACLSEVGGKPSQLRIGSDPESIREWMGEVSARYPNGGVAVCMEQTRGAVAYALGAYAAVDLYPVNPVTLSNYRKAFRPSGAKDDPGDAALCLDLLVNHRETLSRLEPDDERTRKLQLFCELRRKAVGRRTRVTNELVSTLKQYYPQALTLVGDNRHSEMACALLMRWTRFEAVAATDFQAIREFYYAHHSRSERCIRRRLKLIASGCPLTTDPAIVEPLMMHTRQLVSEIRALNTSVARYDRRIRELFADHPEAALFRSFPGAGEHLAPRLLVAFGTNRKRYRAAEEMAAYSGVAPVIESSGKSKWVHWRWHCPKFMRQSFVEFAAKSVGQCEWAAIHYQTQLRRGKEHNAAIRSLAFKWIRIMFRCWQERRPYDENQYLDALARHGSWIAGELRRAG
jgi:transposase